MGSYSGATGFEVIAAKQLSKDKQPTMHGVELSFMKHSLDLIYYLSKFKSKAR